MPITQVVLEKAQNIIKEGVDAQFRGKVSFDSFRITPRSGPDDEDYQDVLVAYGSGNEDLVAQLLNSTYERSDIVQRATNHEAYRVSQPARKWIDKVVGWVNTVDGGRKMRHCGIARNPLRAEMTIGGFHLVRSAELTATTAWAVGSVRSEIGSPCWKAPQ